MHVDIQMPYTITFIPKGRKNAVTETFSRPCRLNVHEVSSEDAPVAVRWAYPRANERYDHLRSAETRWFDGRHWVAKFHGPANLPVGVDSLYEFERRGSIGNPLRDIFRSLLTKQNQFFPEYSFEPAEVRTVQNDTYEDYKKRAQKVVDDLILIDGQFWEASPEPRLNMATKNISRTLENGADPGVYYYVGFSGLGTSAYRVDRIEDACVAFGVDPEVSAPKVEVLIPESLSIADDYWAGLCGASKVITFCSSEHVKWGWDKIRAFYEFRDLYLPFHNGIGFDAPDRDPTEDELDAICESALEYLEFFAPEQVVEERFLLERWKNRTIDFSPGSLAP